MWRGLSDADKKPYEDMAAADKVRVDKLKADMPPMPKPTKPAKADKPNKVPRAKTVYVLFCDGKREETKAANPGTAKGDINKLLAAAWKECSPEDKLKLQEQSQVAKMELQASAALQTLASVKTKKQGKIAKPAAVEEGAGEEEEQEAEDKEASAASGEESMAASPGVGDEDAAAPAAAALADDESDDEADREPADWDANPAEMIIGHTYHNKYTVKRKGLDFTEYGLVDARAAKRQRLNTDSNDPKQALQASVTKEVAEGLSKQTSSSLLLGPARVPVSVSVKGTPVSMSAAGPALAATLLPASSLPHHAVREGRLQQQRESAVQSRLQELRRQFIRCQADTAYMRSRRCCRGTQSL